MDDSGSETSARRPAIPLLEETVVRVGEITKLDDGRLCLRRTFRDPEYWINEPNTFGLKTAFANMGISKESKKKMFFFPDSGYHPYEISNETELNGAARCMLVDMHNAPGWEKQLSFFVSEDVEHLLAFECHHFRKHQSDLHCNHL